MNEQFPKFLFLFQEKQDFRGIDRLVDIMQGDKFGFLILAKPIGNERLKALRGDVFRAYEMLSMAAKQSVQLGINNGGNHSVSKSSGKNFSTGTNTSITTSTNESQTKGRNSGTSSGGSYSSSSSGTNSSETYGGSKSTSKGSNKTVGENTGTSESSGTQQGSSLTLNSDLTNKAAADWVKYFDEVLIPRLDYAQGKGAFVVNMTLLGENPQVARKLSQAALETLAVIAYHQPVSREGVRSVRGVNSDGVIASLKEKGLVREVGKDARQAALFGTTTQFLQTFGLRSVADLPPLEDFAPDEESRRFIRERLSGRSMEASLEEVAEDLQEEQELLGDVDE